MPLESWTGVKRENDGGGDKHSISCPLPHCFLFWPINSRKKNEKHTKTLLLRKLRQTNYRRPIFKRRLLIFSWLNREEKSSRHVAMVAKCPDDNKPNNSFLLNTLKTLFRLSTALLDLFKSILSVARKFVSARSS